MAPEPETTDRDAHAGPSTPAARRRASVRPGPIDAPPAPAVPPSPPVASPPPPVDAPPQPDRGAELSRLETGAARVRVADPRPPSGEKRAAALLALAVAAVGLLFQVPSLLSSGSSAAGRGGLSVKASLTAVAPGGSIALEGAGAPREAEVVLEMQAPGQGWRAVGEARSAGDGDFRVEGRVAARPGKVALRARVVGAGTSAPVGVPVRALRLASVGDINLGDAPGAAIASDGPRYPWESAGTALRQADIAFGNLECAVSERGERFPKKYNFRGSSAALAGLRRHSGMDVLNLANNHVGDFGQAAMLDTVRGVRAMGMRAVGAGRDLRGALTPQVVERLGLRIAFVGFSNILPAEFAATDDRPGVAWATAESVASAVRAASRRADVVVATFHWGIEKAPFETADQQELAAVAASAGANLVIGAHPHVLQPMRRSGAALVAYSLGNFVFGAHSAGTSSTGILETDLTAEGVSAARWLPGQIVGSRPLLDDSPPRPLPLADPAEMAAGVTLG